MRTALLLCAIVGFAGLGVLDLLDGNPATGVASLMLAAANWLLLA